MLTKEENLMLIELVSKLKWPMDIDVFRALVLKITTIPIDLCILDNENRVFTIYRKDPEYEGHHMPGTVLRNNETISEVLSRLIQTEVEMEITEPENIGWFETKRGLGYGENPTRHEISLLFVARLKSTYNGNGGVFSPLDALPDDTLPHHRIRFDKVKTYLKNNS